MKRWMFAFCLAFAVTAFLSASAWEGSAMMSAYGEFPDAGNYAACNSFPRNTAVEVVNLENGKTVTVIITKDLDNPGIFLLLSPEAAKTLTMVPGMVSRVRVSAPRNMTETFPPSSPSMDPDFNPSLLAVHASKYPSTAAKEPMEAEQAPSAPVAALEESASLAELPEKEATVALPAPDSIALQEAPAEQAPDTKEIPIVRPELLFRPGQAPIAERPITAYLEIPEGQEAGGSREEKVVAYSLEKPDSRNMPIQAALVDPSLLPDVLPETALLRQAWPAIPEPSAYLADCEIRMEEPGKPEALAMAGAGANEEVPLPRAPLEEPQGVVRETKEPANLSRIVLSQKPEEPKPTEAPAPSVAKGAKPAEVNASTRGPAPFDSRAVATTLEPGRYYIQIGAYKSSLSLEGAAQKLYGTFPVTIDTVKTGVSPLYRLFVGPLGRDESGVMLLKVRSLGFKDAFLKN